MFFFQNGFISINCITIKSFVNFGGSFNQKEGTKEEIEDKNGAKEGSFNFSGPKKELSFL